MIPFLSMLQGTSKNDNSRLGQAIGAKGASFIRPSDKGVGMQFVNSNASATEVPNIMNMLMGARQMSNPGGPAGKLPVFDILAMLRGGR